MATFGKGKDTSGGAYNNMRSVQAFKKLNLTFHWLTTVDNLSSKILHELGEADDLIFDLVSQFAGMAYNHSTAGLGIVRNSLQDGQYKDGGLSHTRYSLAKDILAKDCNGNAALLYVRRMLKTAIGDALEQLRLEQHIFE